MQRYAIIITLCLALPGMARGQQSGLGVGPFLGSAVGVAAKGWVNTQYALAAGLGVSVEDDNSMHLHADYLTHSAEAPQKLAFFRNLGGDGLFLAYYGAGARLKLFDLNRLGARATLGLAYAAGGSTWDAFIEVVPVLDVIPDSDWTITAFIGWRWFVELDQRSSPTPVF
ncbi:MAG: hypothetical protein VCE12_21335 [Candidatus Latescibacterota bacterium]